MVIQANEQPTVHQPAPVGPATAEELRDPGWAWAAYEPDGRRPWNLALAAHLYRRAAFGADWKQLQQALADGPQRTVDRLLEPPAEAEAFNRTYDGHEDVAANSLDGLRAWWLRRMMETPQPLLEKMALFWHSHFATNGAAVNNPRLMQGHIHLLRRHALGSFASLLQAISRDPVLLTWLGAEANRKAAPHEGFVRPLLETFTLGPGQFTEQDVREAARACTGWFVLRGQLRYLAPEHDEGRKHILGREGEFSADDVVRIVLEQPATARLLVRRLYHWLISETEEPAEALLAPLVESFASDYSVSRLVGKMLRSNVFFSELSYRRRIKGPVEFAVGIVKALEGVVSATHLAQDIAGLGQDLCRPPTVKGWPGGRCWINAATAVRRCNLLLALLHGEEPYDSAPDPWAVAQRHGYRNPESAAQFLIDLFVQGDLDPEVRRTLFSEAQLSARNADDAPRSVLRGVAYAVTTVPEFHLA